MTHLTQKTRSLPDLIVLLLLFFAASTQVAAQGATAAGATAAGATVASGSWTKKTQSASGTWKITEAGDQLKFEVSSDFKTRKAPDLKIFLSPLTASEAQNNNAVNESLLVAELPKVSGSFEVTLPAGTNLSDYNSVLVHCEKYTKLWVASDLH